MTSRNKNLPFKIISTYLETGSVYRTAKKLRKPNSLVIYHLKHFQSLGLPIAIKEKAQEIGLKLIPVLQKEFVGLSYEQVDFLLQYLFYHVLNEFQP